MIIFFQSGRLGNQLFQYCAMRKLRPKDCIVAIGMADLSEIFDGIDLRNKSVFGGWIKRFVDSFGEKRVASLAKMRLFSHVEEVQTEEGVGFKLSQGLIRGVLYFKAGYYQSEAVIVPTVIDKLSLRAGHRPRAQEFLQSLPCDRSDLFFVHVRRGDYTRWPSEEYPAVLPPGWFKEQMKRVRVLRPNAHFVVISDDHAYAEEVFSDEDNLFIHRGNFIDDFAVMTQCSGGGILSASSYSWWGAYFVKRENKDALFIAPLHWGGHRLGVWYPPAIKTSWIKYFPVQNDQAAVRARVK
jgi:hypothetical protein